MQPQVLWRLAVLVVLLTGILLAVIYFDEVKDVLADFLDWITTVWYGPLVFIVVYIGATVFFVPGLILTLGAGFAFGIGLGFVYVSAGSTIGAILAFLLGRTLLREWIAEKIAKYPKFDAVDQAIGEEGLKIVALLRLSPIFPFSLLNYALALTSVSFKVYAGTSWIAMMPGTLLYVYIGSALGDVADAIGGNYKASTEETIFYIVGLVATFVAVTYIVYVAKKAINKALAKFELENTADQEAAEEGLQGDAQDAIN